MYVRTIAIRGYEINPDRLLLFANFEKYGNTNRIFLEKRTQTESLALSFKLEF